MSLSRVRERISAAAGRAGRRPEDLRLVVVSKGRTSAEIERLYVAGQRDFGENRAQELGGKVDELPADIRWHFVGPLQTNKVRQVRPVVSWLHSLDRVDLAAAWLKGPGTAPQALLQVNIGREPQKQGFDPDQAEAACKQVLDMGVELVGVMAIPPLPQSPEDSRPYLAGLRRIRDRLERIDPRITELSMGMTDDFEVAVEEGATVLRVGRAIFDA